MLKALSRGLISAVFPLCCQLCGGLLRLRGGSGVCGACEASLPLIEAPHCPRCGRHSAEARTACPACRDERLHFDRAYAASPYDNRVKNLLCAFKFKRQRILERTLLGLLKRRLDALGPLPSWDGVVAVPMPRALRFERGFNQAEVFAKGVAALTGKPYWKNALTVRRAAVQQSRLPKAARIENVRGLFLAAKGAPLAQRRVLLVDDILTTGQTASECARALKEAGAAAVDLLVVARGQ